MHVMCSLAWRQMRQQKRRTVITILGVIVAVAMIAAVSSFAATFTDLFVREKIAMDGDWHARISGTTAADREKIAADPRVRSVFVMGQHGVYSLPQRMGRIGQARIISLDAAGLDAMQVRLLSGAYPQQTGELLISDSFAKGAGLKTGDALTLLDETGAETRFTICGTASMTPLETVAAGEGCALIAQPEETRLETGDAIIRLYKPDRGIYDWLQALCEGLPGEQRYDTHTSLLIYQGVSSNDTILATIYAMEAIIMVIILAAAVSLIYNAFAISVTDRAAQFGMLSSIGATMRQRRRAVLFEALTIALIAIPFGLVFGYLGIGITFAVVNSLMTELVTGSSSAALQLVVSPGAVALSVGLALITVLISAWIPARRAARVSPMEAIRKTQDIKLSGKEVKTSRLTRRLFGFEGELALKNLKRNKKRYRVTTFSLAMSLILFLSAYSFTHYMTASYTTAVEEQESNLHLSVYPFDMPAQGDFPYGVLDALEERALAVPQAQQAAAYTFYNRGFSAVLAQRERYTAQLQALLGEEEALAASVIAMDDDSLAALAQALGASLEELKDPQAPAAILVNGGTLYHDQRFDSLTLLDVRPGDQITLSGTHYAGQNRDKTTRDYSLRVAAVTAERPFGLSGTLLSPEALIILSETAARALLPQTKPRLEVLIQAENDALGEEELQALKDEFFPWGRGRALTDEEVDRLIQEGGYLQISLQNYASARRAAHQLTAIINIFIYGFITLLSLVGAANIVGTISTSLLLRKREFAMVKSVGMGNRAFDRMIRCESVFYGLKAVAWGLAGSVVAVFLMWKAVGQSFSLPFQLPWVQMLIGVAAVFLLVALTMAYSVHKIRNDSIVEDLRLE